MPSRNDVANIEAGLGGQQRQRAVDNRLVVPPGVRAWSVVIILLFVVSVLFEFAGLIYLVMKEDSNPFLVRKQALFTLMTVLSGTVIVMITIGQALRDILHVLLLEALIYPIVLFHLLDFQGLLFP
ncbi:uncharacterized protein K452DRAFT_291775 [Aplosporella prunicola CBS 121167]|uniref:Uncharacterized protein n=1 Tax=Aplosporella prunicola CBS 121167 TaxID=1176127 RepID=A0A6A6AZN0_9PEZI|nr:uncharacterized protein K452DRAFT_291775 [Aplosporella prunicola CBS 121167]KAF2137240.1 hypothetical protein K452DRAFT_291775 [Aplosporella prunicola CBS 121167]